MLTLAVRVRGGGLLELEGEGSDETGQASRCGVDWAGIYRPRVGGGGSFV